MPPRPAAGAAILTISMNVQVNLPKVVSPCLDYPHLAPYRARFGASLVRVEPRPAATVILMRETHENDGFEVLLLKRSTELEFSAGAYVFPGGAVDPSDLDLATRCIGITDAEASKNLGLDEGGIAFYVAAIRECFEEAGIMLVSETSGRSPAPHLDLRSPKSQDRYTSLRRSLNERELTFPNVIVSNELYLTAEDLRYVSHWITPPGGRRRYDTRFFVSMVPDNQDVLHDESEIVDSLWLKPKDALEKFERRELMMIFPTLRNLKAIAGFRTTGEVFEWAAGLSTIPTLSPIRVFEYGEPKFVLPGEELKRP